MEMWKRRWIRWRRFRRKGWSECDRGFRLLPILDSHDRCRLRSSTRPDHLRERICTTRTTVSRCKGSEGKSSHPKYCPTVQGVIVALIISSAVF